jgi:hypothetical protein
LSRDRAPPPGAGDLRAACAPSTVKLAVQPHAADLCFEAAEGYERSTLSVAENAGQSVPFIIREAAMGRVSALLFLNLLLLGCGTLHPGSAGSPGAWEVTSVAAGPGGTDVLKFAGGHEFATTLYGVQYLGQIPVRGRAPYLIMAARGCTECCANLTIYIHSPADGPMKGEADQPLYAYPGVISDWQSEVPGDTVSSRARFFFGDCMPSISAKAIWFSEERVAPGRLEPSALFLYEERGELHEANLMQLVGGEAHAFIGLDEVLRQVSRGRCREVPALDQAGEP